MVNKSFWVVIPAFNEQKLIKGTLDALVGQTDTDFNVVVVDNNSTDNTRQIVEDYVRTKSLNLVLVTEKSKGTGTASDKGFRYAIEHGAKYIARTDADALPEKDWVQVLKTGFNSGLLFIGGRIAPRKDEENYTWFDGVILNTIIRIFEHAPRFFYKRSNHKYPLFMAAGLNMAIEANLYQKVGGFPHTSIDDTDEDLELHHKVCAEIDGNKAKLLKKAKVYGSIRKAKSMGYFGIVMWYWDRKHSTAEVDVR